MINVKKISVYTCLAVVMLSYICLISFSVFEIFSEVSLFVFVLAIAILVFCNSTLRSNELFVLLILSAYLLISVIYNSGGLGSVLTFVVPLILLFQFERIQFTKQFYKFLRAICFVAVLYLFIKSFIYSQDWTYHRFNDINPNTMSIFLLYAYMYFVSMLSLNVRKNRLLFVIVTLGVVFALYNYESRMALLVLVVYALHICFLHKTSSKYFFYFSVVSLIVGIIFPIIYLTLYRNNVALEIFGKSLYTGRETIWSNMFDKFNENPLSWVFGLGSKVKLWDDRTLNVHNNCFAIIVDFGIIGLCFFCVLILKRIKSIKANSIRVKKLLLTFVCTAFLLGITEVTTMWSVTFAMVFLSLGMAISENKRLK